MSMLDWLGDTGIFGGGPTAPPVQMTGIEAPPTPPNPNVTDIAGGMQGAGPSVFPPGTDPMTAGLKPPLPPSQATQPMPPAQGLDLPPPVPFAQGGDPMQANPPPFPQGGDPMAGTGSGSGPGLPQPAPVPMPQARPPGATVAPPQQQPGAPVSLAPPAPGPSTPAGPAQTALGRALGITPDQAGKQGQQIMAGIGAGLKAVPANSHAPGLAALAGTAGAAIEGGAKKADTQQKQAADYLKASIDAKKAGDEAGYKQNYLRYLAAKLQADTEKAATKEAGANKNDSPTQLYLSAQRLVQPERNALNKQIEQMRKEGADPAAIAKAQADGEAAINGKLNDHFATLGIHPQTAAQIAQQPGNSLANPLDAGKLGITKDNIGTKLQPGQYFTNPSDGKVYQYKGPPKKEAAEKKATPDKPTNPEPADPMNKSAVSTGAMTPAVKSNAASDDDDED